jgi:hypothetical protein
LIVLSWVNMLYLVYEYGESVLMRQKAKKHAAEYDSLAMIGMGLVVRMLSAERRAWAVNQESRTLEGWIWPVAPWPR